MPLAATRHRPSYSQVMPVARPESARRSALGCRWCRCAAPRRKAARKKPSKPGRRAPYASGSAPGVRRDHAAVFVRHAARGEDDRPRPAVVLLVADAEDVLALELRRTARPRARGRGAGVSSGSISSMTAKAPPVGLAPSARTRRVGRRRGNSRCALSRRAAHGRWRFGRFVTLGYRTAVDGRLRGRSGVPLDTSARLSTCEVKTHGRSARWRTRGRGVARVDPRRRSAAGGPSRRRWRRRSRVTQQRADDGGPPP